MTMNRRQETVLIVAVLLLFLSVLFPPHFFLTSRGHKYGGGNFGFLFAPPKPSQVHAVRIEVDRLVLECAAIGLLAAASIYLLRERR